ILSFDTNVFKKKKKKKATSSFESFIDIQKEPKSFPPYRTKITHLIAVEPSLTRPQQTGSESVQQSPNRAPIQPDATRSLRHTQRALTSEC
ncbi:hypothetical protein PGIGA_G00148270, partial [Pangasianodon gigas]|nr:hypothetical protein [Pangasianodon gigas]